jgi:hypothetical protein
MNAVCSQFGIQIALFAFLDVDGFFMPLTIIKFTADDF